MVFGRGQVVVYSQLFVYFGANLSYALRYSLIDARQSSWA